MDKQGKKKIIGKFIGDKRQDKGLTQVEVAEMTGLSRNYISDIENGRYMPSVDSLFKLASCLNLDLNSLLKMTEKQVI